MSYVLATYAARAPRARLAWRASPTQCPPCLQSQVSTDELEQRLQAHRLRQVVRRTRLIRDLVQLLLVERRDEDHGDVGELLIGSQDAADVRAVDAGHED